MRNKTAATWLTLVGGVFGLHRFYLHGMTDVLGWLLPVPTLLGLYGVYRARGLGLDDHWSWALIPLLGFVFAACALNAIVYGLTDQPRWNGWFNPDLAPDSVHGGTNWLTIGAVFLAMLTGATALIAAIAFGIQRIFEWQAG
ncbi:MAG: hypothetical protein LH632_19275 [Rhodoferax sp.]|nr:hypothetical protein [Rhodoferax sp.]